MGRRGSGPVSEPQTQHIRARANLRNDEAIPVLQLKHSKSRRMLRHDLADTGGEANEQMQDTCDVLLDLESAAQVWAQLGYEGIPLIGVGCF